MLLQGVPKPLADSIAPEPSRARDGDFTGVIEDRLFELIDPLLKSHGTASEAGEEYREPALEVLRYYRRAVRWNPLPFLGRGLSVVAVVRQPLDLELASGGTERLLGRVARAACGRFPPSKGAVLGLTTVVLTAEPIRPGDEQALAAALDVSLRRYRVIPFGILKLNLGQEAIAWGLKSGPDQLFPEPVQLADALGERFRRFVPLIDA